MGRGAGEATGLETQAARNRAVLGDPPNATEIEERLTAYGIHGDAVLALLVIFELFKEHHRRIVSRKALAEVWRAVDWSRFEIDVPHEGDAIGSAHSRLKGYIDKAPGWTQERPRYWLMVPGLERLIALREAAGSETA